MSKYYVQDPQATLPYPLDFSDFIAKGDPVAEVIAEADVGAVVESIQQPDEDGLAVVVISGSTMVPGRRYKVTFHFTTESDFTDDRSIVINCRER